MDLVEFNAAPADRLRSELVSCCDVPRWVEGILAKRPYGDRPALTAVADQLARELDDNEVDRALQAHPRIGDRPQGAGTEAAWSRKEQSGVGDDPEVRAALAEGNREYEDRFGRVFLICATGLTAAQMLSSLQDRLTHDDAVEAVVVHEELRKIALLRLNKLVIVSERSERTKGAASFAHDGAERSEEEA
ncbi:2-oxo-4-hydroxy-4-carboxy-5-ureidoimidazoline decarboxylase [Kribbella sp. NBC_01505]|uniref:2-oxo-4-hydroxy-4-carboxy-5-ureidoimidazoline decarboxylase n=1 Tax=Kribbella sp. NBC_01505 TaxID=2903580 RepID=UPI00386FF3F7